MNEYKKKEIALGVLSWALTFGYLVVLIVVALGRYANPGPAVESDFVVKYGTEATAILNRLKTVATTALVSVLPMGVLAVIAKNKVKPLVCMANILLSNLLFGNTIMYVAFGVWFVDTYVLTPLKNNAHTDSRAYNVARKLNG